MKKLLLFIVACCLITANVVQAQPAFTTVWEKTITAPRETAKAVSNEHTVLSTQGELYAVGNFSQPFSFGTQDLEPIANSTYLLKYSATGEEMWAVSFAGAATATAVTLDDAGNVYVTGRMADAVVFNTTSGTPITKTGNSGTNLISAFVAKYNANGVLQGVEVFVPTKQDIDYEATPEFYFSNIQVANGKIYVSAILKGNVINNGVTLAGKTADIWSIGYFVDIQSGYILTLTNALQLENIIAAFSVTTNNDIVKTDVYDANFVVEGNDMYMGFVANGNKTLKIGSSTTNVVLNTPEGGNWEYVYQLAKFNLTTNDVLLKDYKTTVVPEYNRCRINKMTSLNNGLILEGTFNSSSLAFDAALNYTSADDVFAAKLNKADLTVLKAQKSGIDEASATKNEEVFMASAVSNNYLMQAAKTDVVGVANLNSFLITSDIVELTAAVAQQPSQKFITGLNAKDDKLLEVTVNTTTTPTITYKVSKVTASGVSNKFVTGIQVYPNPVLDVVKLSNVCDIVLISSTGSRIKQVKSVSSLNVSELPSGVYYIIATNDKGTDTFKISKK